MYQQLRLGDLRPTRVTIQLADRSVKIPKREIIDVLIRVGEFIYPVDFIVLEMQIVHNPKAQTPVILGRPFLATANAIINYRNGSMHLTFGDMTKEVNVFHLGKQPRDLKNESFEVNLIEGLASEHEMKIEYESDREFELESDDFNLDQIIESTVEWATDAAPILPLHKEQPLIDQVPSSELKVLLVISSISTWVKRKHFP